MVNALSQLASRSASSLIVSQSLYPADSTDCSVIPRRPGLRFISPLKRASDDGTNADNRNGWRIGGSERRAAGANATIHCELISATDNRIERLRRAYHSQAHAGEIAQA